MIASVVAAEFLAVVVAAAVVGKAVEFAPVAVAVIVGSVGSVVQLSDFVVSAAGAVAVVER